MSGFTSGPWQEMDDYTPEGRLTIIGNVDGEYFTDSAAPVMSYQFVALLEDEHGETHERTAANRRLILAAPDLYAVLRLIMGTTDGLFTVAMPASLRDIARQALAKASPPITTGN